MARLGDLVKTKRESMGLSLRDFADLCGLSHAYIKNIEDGDPRTGKETVPSINCLERIAPALSMSFEELLNEIGFIHSKDMLSVKKVEASIDLDGRAFGNSGFEPSNLTLIRGDKTYEEICADMQRKTGETVEPAVFETIEKGKDMNPSILIIDKIARYAGVERTFFYRKNTVEVLEYARKQARCQYSPAGQDTSLYIKEDLREFVTNPENEEYIRLAKELSEKNIKVKFIRNALFKE